MTIEGNTVHTDDGQFYNATDGQWTTVNGATTGTIQIDTPTTMEARQAMTGSDVAGMFIGISFAVVLLAVAVCGVVWTAVGSWAVWKMQK